MGYWLLLRLSCLRFLCILDINSMNMHNLQYFFHSVGACWLFSLPHRSFFIWYKLICPFLLLLSLLLKSHPKHLCSHQSPKVCPPCFPLVGSYFHVFCFSLSHCEVIFFTIFKIDVYSFERGTDAETEISHPLLYSPNACKNTVPPKTCLMTFVFVLFCDES